MIKKFDNQAIEKKWQEKWSASKLYDAGDRDASKEKRYVLVELPYPSGNLHIGHWYAFAVPDIYVRYLRMTGKQVVYPMGFDAFGLPAENAAIKRNLDPRSWTNNNIAFMRTQLASMGNAFSWDKTASTTDPDYYRWTQWMFTKFFENDIAYRGQGTVNWCPGCNTVIANEQVLPNGTCERSGDVVEKKQMSQWMLRITNYADRLVDDLEALDWPEHIKEAQRQWIGRSEGAYIDFKLSTGDTVTVFTTRPDTLFGATYLVLAPEHPLVDANRSNIRNWNEIAAYTTIAKQKAEQDRLDATKEKTGGQLEGITATNPANGETIPVFIADYVLASYGTGAIMGVPAHDERDLEFARKFGLRVISVVAPKKITCSGALLEVKGKPGTFLFQKRTADAPSNPGMLSVFGGRMEEGEDALDAVLREVEEELELKLDVSQAVMSYTYPALQSNDHIAITHFKDVDITSYVLHEGEAALEFTIPEILAREDVVGDLRAFLDALSKGNAYFTGSGVLFQSQEFDGMDSEAAKTAITAKVNGKKASTYRLRDWSVGRQRYWGVPIPIVYDPEGKAHAIPEEHLPWLLPDDVDFRPTGEPPLAKSKELQERAERIFGTGWKPEVETMDTFVDSSWYFLRYLDNSNNSALASLERQREWMPVDLYFGGAEHTTMHLLYSRFWQKALYDLKLVTEIEPYKRRINRGLILGPDGAKMSKSKGNVIDPDEQVRYVGSDAVKIYLAFMGPYEGSNYPWDMGGIAGIRRFLERVNGLNEHLSATESKEISKLLHKTIAKVASDIVEFKFNTAISAMMIFTNAAEKEGLTKETFETFLQVLAPFAPHLTEELWESLGHANSIHTQPFPEASAELAADDVVVIGVQVNGKIRGSVSISPHATESEAVTAAKAESNIMKYLTSDTKKVIYVPGRILNLIQSD